MTGVRRVHEIAKGLNRTSKELVDVLQKIGVDAKGPNSPISEEDEARLRSSLFGVKGREEITPQTAISEILKASPGGVRLRKKTPKIEAPAPAKAAEPVAESEADALLAAPADGPAVSETALTPAETPGVPPEKVEPKETAAGALPAAVVSEETGAKAKKSKKAAPPKPAPAGATILDELEPESAKSVPADALRRVAGLAPARGRAATPRPGKVQPRRPHRGPEGRLPDILRRKHAQKHKSTAPVEPKAPPPKKKVVIRAEATLGELSLTFGLPLERIIEVLAENGVTDKNVLSLISPQEQAHVAASAGFDPEAVAIPPQLQPRPPVVTVLGHVDHGKTTLLDALRKTNVVASESGGITQHVGASVVKTAGGSIVFIDTPGHEVFTQMRARGAQVTDVVVLVVAADDGIMPQTIESINHARAAGVPIVVAVTKIDKNEADVLKTKKGLMEKGVTTEDWGGDVLAVEVSALRNLGLDKLLEVILLQAEMLEFKGDASVRASGVVIEASLDRGRGAVMTVLVKRGTLKIGDAFVVGRKTGRIRAMFDTTGKGVKTAGPATPVTILGAETVPDAGDVLVAMPNEKTARGVASLLVAEPEKEAEPEGVYTLDEWYKQFEEGGKGELDLIIKADVMGSAEALAEQLKGLGNAEVGTKLVHTGVGAVNESDVLLASASKAIVVAFRVNVEPKAKALATREGVEVRPYDVIYEVIADMRAALEGMLEPVIISEVIGTAEIRQVFEATGGRIAGSFVRTGRVARSSRVRVLREREVVFEGGIASLRRFRDDVREVQQGYECGIQLAGFSDVAAGDVIEVLEERRVARRLDEK